MKYLPAAACAALLMAGSTLSVAAEDAVRRLDTVLVQDDNAPTVAEYMAEPTLTNMSISPNGNFVAAVRRSGLDYYVVVADLRKDRLEFVGTLFDDLAISNVEWANDDRLIVEAYAVFNARSRSIMDPQDWFNPEIRRQRVDALYGMDRDGGNLVRFFEGSRKLDNIFTDAELLDLDRSDPDHVLVQIRAPELSRGKSESIQMGGADIYKLNVMTGDYDDVVRGEKRTLDYETDKQGRLVYRVDENAAGNRQNFFVANYSDSGRVSWKKAASLDTAELFDELNRPFGMTILGGSNELPYVYVRDVPAGEDRHAIYLYNIVTQEHVEMIAAHPDYDMGSQFGDSIVRDPVTDELIGVRWEGKKPETLYFDPAMQRHHDALQQYFGDQVTVVLVDKSLDGKKWVVASTGPGDPGTYAVYDTENVKITEIGERFATLSGKARYEKKVINYKARDGESLFGYLTLPFGEAKGNHPIVVMPHGGPQARDNFRWDDTAQLLASRGYAVFQPQFRGSAGFGKTFAESGYREWSGLMQTDVEDGFYAITKAGYADRSRACIMGFSYGAYAAMAGGVKTPDDYKCVIAGGGVYDLYEMQRWSRAVRGENSETYKYWTRQLGDTTGNYDDLIERSPARNLDKLKAPVFLFHGKRDNIVPIEQGEMLRDRLRSAGATFEYVEMKKAGHQFGAPRTSEPVDIHEDILVFLAEHNPTDRNRLR